MKELAKQRQRAILKILDFIQDGGELEEVKKIFQTAFDQVDVTEITVAERELITQGLDPGKTQYLYGVHANVFKGNTKEDEESPEFEIPGHPVHTLELENTITKSLTSDALLPDLAKWEAGSSDTLPKLKQELKDLTRIHYHYARKETPVLPSMAKYGIIVPPKVVRGVDDKIRKLTGQTNMLVNQKNVDPSEVTSVIKNAIHKVLEMIFKEEKIMLPTLDEVASEEDWGDVKNGEEQIGYASIQGPMSWKSKIKPKAAGPIPLDRLSSLVLDFTESSLNLEQLSAVLGPPPSAIAFVDRHGRVAYFGRGASIFPHSKSTIGNSVYSCYLPKSMS